MSSMRTFAALASLNHTALLQRPGTAGAAGGGRKKAAATKKKKKASKGRAAPPRSGRRPEGAVEGEAETLREELQHCKKMYWEEKQKTAALKAQAGRAEASARRKEKSIQKMLQAGVDRGGDPTGALQALAGERTMLQRLNKQMRALEAVLAAKDAELTRLRAMDSTAVVESLQQKYRDTHARLLRANRALRRGSIASGEGEAAGGGGGGGDGQWAEEVQLLERRVAELHEENGALRAERSHAIEAADRASAVAEEYQQQLMLDRQRAEETAREVEEAAGLRLEVSFLRDRLESEKAAAQKLQDDLDDARDQLNSEKAGSVSVRAAEISRAEQAESRAAAAEAQLAESEALRASETDGFQAELDAERERARAAAEEVARATADAAALREQRDDSDRKAHSLAERVTTLERDVAEVTKAREAAEARAAAAAASAEVVASEKAEEKPATGQVAEPAAAEEAAAAEEEEGEVEKSEEESVAEDTSTVEEPAAEEPEKAGQKETEQEEKEPEQKLGAEEQTPAKEDEESKLTEMLRTVTGPPLAGEVTAAESDKASDSGSVQRGHRRNASESMRAEVLEQASRVADDMEESVAESEVTYEDAPTHARVLVGVLEARDLPALDSNGLSDPYAKCSVGSSSYSTKVVKKTLAPRWDEAFDCGVHRVWPGDADADAGEALSAADELVVELWDKDKVKKDDYMGCARLNLGDLARRALASGQRWPVLVVDDWFSIGAKKAAVSLCVTLQVVDDEEEEENDDSSSGSEGEFNVVETSAFRPLPGGHSFPNEAALALTVVRATGLPALDLNGLSDPYVVLKLAGATHRTAVVPKSLEPEWGERFDLGTVLLHPGNHEHLEVAVLDKDRVSSDTVGRFTVNLREAALKARNNGGTWPNLSGEQWFYPNAGKYPDARVLFRFDFVEPEESRAAARPLVSSEEDVSSVASFTMTDTDNTPRKPRSAEAAFAHGGLAVTSEDDEGQEETTGDENVTDFTVSSG